MRSILKSTALSVAIALSCQSPAALAQSQLPTLGDRISGIFSLDEEYKLGRDFLRSVRRTTPTISDPLINDYVVNFTHNLAVHSDLQDYRLAFIVVDSPALNAFATPGGVIGVNGGLFLNAHTEGEFASVMAHEIAHVSQRHFARSVEDAQRRRIPELATLLASIVLMGSGSSAGPAAVMAAQGRSIENQLRFSRQNEAEADRIGLRTMVEAERLAPMLHPARSHAPARPAALVEHGDFVSGGGEPGCACKPGHSGPDDCDLHDGSPMTDGDERSQ